MIAPSIALALSLAGASTSTTAATVTSSIALSEKRAMPDYDGRPDEEATAGDVALWVPRITLFPLWLISEYVVRRPLGWLVVNAEKNQWPSLVLDFFTFGEERTAGVFPSALIDFGFRPSVGVYGFWNEVISDRNSARLYAAYGGDDWYAIRLADRIAFEDGKSRVAFTFGYTHRPDFRFEGIGSDPVDDFLARYRLDRLEGSITYDHPIGDAGHFSAFAGARRVIFRTGEPCCEDRGLDEVIAAGEIPAPPGWNNNYSVYEHGLSIEWDTRKPRPASGDGFRLELSASQAIDIGTSLRTPWVNIGASAGGFIDLTDHHRVLSVFVSTEFIEPIDHDEIVPFTELVTVGGAGSLPGFKPGTLLGQSRINGSLEYRWPIWVFLDGTAHVAVGNVFGERLEGFRWDLLRMSFGIGMRTSGRPDHAFNILVAAGTDNFKDGAEITTFRFVLGTTRGF